MAGYGQQDASNNCEGIGRCLHLLKMISEVGSAEGGLRSL
jgi:hypothetical protein